MLAGVLSLGAIACAEKEDPEVYETETEVETVQPEIVEPEVEDDMYETEEDLINPEIDPEMETEMETEMEETEVID